MALFQLKTESPKKRLKVATTAAFVCRPIQMKEIQNVTTRHRNESKRNV